MEGEASSSNSSSSRRKKTAVPNDYGFIDTVFSWSLEDILNENLYKEKVCFLLHFHPHLTVFWKFFHMDSWCYWRFAHATVVCTFVQNCSLGIGTWDLDSFSIWPFTYVTTWQKLNKSWPLAVIMIQVF